MESEQIKSGHIKMGWRTGTEGLSPPVKCYLMPQCNETLPPWWEKKLLSFWCVGIRQTHCPSSSEAMTTPALTIFSSQSHVLISHLPMLKLQINAHALVHAPCTCSHYPVFERNLELRLETRFHFPAGRVIINNWWSGGFIRGTASGVQWRATVCTKERRICK